MTTSLKYIVAQKYGLLKPSTNSKNVHKLKLPYQKHNAPMFTRFRNLIKVGFARNPWDRILSYQSDPIIKNRRCCMGLNQNATFDELLEELQHFADYELDCHLQSYTFLLKRNGKYVHDVLIRFEHVTEDWKKIQEVEDFPDLPHMRISHRDHVWTERQIELVAKRYKDDVEFGNYTPPRPGTLDKR